MLYQLFSFLQSSCAGAIQSNINRNDLVSNAELTKLSLHIILGLIRVIIINDLPHSFIRVYHRLKIFLSMIYNKCSDEHPLIVINAIHILRRKSTHRGEGKISINKIDRV